MDNTKEEINIQNNDNENGIEIENDDKILNDDIEVEKGYHDYLEEAMEESTDFAVIDEAMTISKTMKNRMEGELKELTDKCLDSEQQLNEKLEEYKKLCKQLKHIQDMDILSKINHQLYELVPKLNDKDNQLVQLLNEEKELKEEFLYLVECSKNKTVQPDENVLKLEIFKRLGFELLQDMQGNFKKARITSSKTHKMHSVPIDKLLNGNIDKQEEFELVNHMWDLL